MTTTNRLPTAATFANISDVDQGCILDAIRRQLDEEEATFTPENLESGYARFTNGMTSAKFKRSLRQRRARLEKLAAEFGFWQEGEAA